MDQAHLFALNVKHAGLDAQISREMKRPSPDQSLVARLKKQKLKIKETIAGH